MPVCSPDRLGDFAAVVFVDVANGVAGILAREVVFRPLGRRAVFAVVVILSVFFWSRENLHRKRVFAKPVMASLGKESWDVIQQFRALNPQVRPGSRVAFLNDPFQSWDMLFVAELWFRDRSLEIHVDRHGPLAAEELARQDYVFRFESGTLRQVK